MLLKKRLRYINIQTIENTKKNHYDNFKIYCNLDIGVNILLLLTLFVFIFIITNIEIHGHLCRNFDSSLKVNGYW